MIVTTVTINDFRDWLNKSDSYKNYFSYEGAEALFEYLEDLSELSEENFEYDPIAWCLEYSEYKNFKQFQNNTNYIQDDVKHLGYPDIKTLEDLKDSTEVLEFDGGIIVRDF